MGGKDMRAAAQYSTDMPTVFESPMPRLQLPETDLYNFLLDRDELPCTKDHSQYNLASVRVRPW